MTGDEFTDGESDFERRKFLKALGVGAGVSGLGGIASADDTLSVTESEPLTADEAAAEFQIAQQYDYFNAMAQFVAEGSLDPLPEQVWGHRILTDDPEFNAHEPVILSVPYAGPEGDQMGFLWVCQLADSEGRRRPNGGLGTTAELVDGEYRHRVYGWENETPAILASEPVETTPGDVTAMGWECTVCKWVVDVICDYGLYWLGETGCGWICWSSTCEDSCEVVVDWLDYWLCNFFGSERICSWAGFC